MSRIAAVAGSRGAQVVEMPPTAAGPGVELQPGVAGRWFRLGVGVVVLAISADAAAICRLVSEPDKPPPVIEPEQPVLIIKRTQTIGQTCDPPADAGAGSDAGAGDAGPADAGMADAGPADAGPDAGWPCQPIEGDAITMVVQPRFQIGADGAAFALLMVTPSPPVIQLAAPSLFRDLALATAPEPVVVPNYIEDASLGYQCSDPKWSYGSPGGGCVPAESGHWDYGNDYELPDPTPVDLPDPDDAVVISTLGAYQIARLTLSEPGELASWLDTYGYQYGQADLDAIAPYIAGGWTVVAVRVITDAPVNGGLEPLSLTWAGTEIRLPLAVSRQPAPAEEWLTVYVAADGRYDFPGGDVSYAEASRMAGTTFLTRTQLWADLSLGTDADPVAFAVAGNPTYRDTVEVTQDIRIPSSKCPPPPPPPAGADSGDAGGCCRSSAGSDLPDSAMFGLLLLGFAVWVSARRRS